MQRTCCLFQRLERCDKCYKTDCMGRLKKERRYFGSSSSSELQTQTYSTAFQVREIAVHNAERNLSSSLCGN